MIKLTLQSIIHFSIIPQQLKSGLDSPTSRKSRLMNICSRFFLAPHQYVPESMVLTSFIVIVIVPFLLFSTVNLEFSSAVLVLMTSSHLVGSSPLQTNLSRSWSLSSYLQKKSRFSPITDDFVKVTISVKNKI